MTTRARVAVLASGGGSNLGALYAASDRLGHAGTAEVVAVASDRPDAGALERARARGTPATVLQTARVPGGEPLVEWLARVEPDLIVLAGYLRLVPADVVARYPGRIVNVHPALLPAFGGPGMYGQRVHQAVLDAGVRVSGPTVHFVDEVFDRGAIIAQWPVPVLPADRVETLAARVLAAEHTLLPAVVQAVAAGHLRLGPDGRVVWRTALPDAIHFALSQGAAPPAGPSGPHGLFPTSPQPTR